MSDDPGKHVALESGGETSGKVELTRVTSHLQAARKALDDALVLLKRNAQRRDAPATLKKPR